MEKEMFCFSKMCDACFEQVDLYRNVFSFEMEDDHGEIRQFKGHESCMGELCKTLSKYAE